MSQSDDEEAGGLLEYELPEDAPSLGSQDGRDSWVDLLLGEDIDANGCSALMVRDGFSNMIIRLKYRDGLEEIYDVAIRRQIELKRKDETSN